MATIREKWGLRPTFETLEDGVAWYSRQGFRVVNQTDSTAQLARPKKFSVTWMLCTAVLPYMLYHLMKKDSGVLLLRTSSGVEVRKS